jgi:hypothetical protein
MSFINRYESYPDRIYTEGNHRKFFCFVFIGEGMAEPTALHRVKCQEAGCAYQMLAISDLRYVISCVNISHMDN